jgi:hypothetical protein
VDKCTCTRGAGGAGVVGVARARAELSSELGRWARARAMARAARATPPAALVSHLCCQAPGGCVLGAECRVPVCQLCCAWV